jgi:hypothetical protein
MRTVPTPATLELFEQDIQCYLRWVRVLERASRVRPAGLSRWYQGSVFSVYSRSGTAGSRLRGRNALCFADVKVREEYCGQGFFPMLVDAVLTAGLPFDSLELESVLNAGFADWLARNGFSAFNTAEGWGYLGASFYRSIPPQGRTTSSATESP